MAMPEFSRRVLVTGNGRNYPQNSDNITVEYTGWLYDPKQPDNEHRGALFDSSMRRGPFTTQIGVGRVIKGWDTGVPQMSVGEKSVLTIPANMAYGAYGFPGAVPPNAALIFEVELVAINGRR